MNKKGLILGAVIGYAITYLLAFVGLSIASFVNWQNYLTSFSFNDLFLVRMGIITGIIGAMMGGFYPE